MHRSLQIALGGAALSFGAVVALPSVALADHCGAGQVHGGYAGTCVPQPGGGGQQPGTGQPGGGQQPGTAQPGTQQPGTQQPGIGGGTTSPGTGGGGSATRGGAQSTALPFTGDEVLVLSLAGAGALAAGAAFVVAGRRRHAAT